MSEETKFAWELRIQVSSTDALATILKQPEQFKLIGDIINLTDRDTRAATAPSIQVPSVRPAHAVTNGAAPAQPELSLNGGNGNVAPGTGQFPYGSRTERNAQMKQTIIDSITGGHGTVASMKKNFTSAGYKDGDFQATLEALKKSGYVASAERGVYAVTDLVNGA
jgi:hypothetical protein